MNQEAFVDYYEALQVSPNADTETIARVFRHLAKRYHPDNPDTGDSDKFQALSRAHQVLTDPEHRAAYDVKHSEFWDDRWKIAKQASDDGAFSQDKELRIRIMSLLYIQRRRNMQSPGMGILELARLLGCPSEQTDFHIWYLREKTWVQRMESGQFCLTAAGVDQVEETRAILDPDRLVTAKSSASANTAETPHPTRSLKDIWPKKRSTE